MKCFLHINPMVILIYSYFNLNVLKKLSKFCNKKMSSFVIVKEEKF